MTIPTRTRSFTRGFASFLVATFSAFSFSAELKTHDQWVAAAPSNATTQAAYICFINDGDKDVEITKISAKGYGMAMIHKTMNHGDMVMMEEVPSLVVPAHKMLTLEPGDMHIMLMDPEKPHVLGDKVPLTVYYKDGSKQTFNLEVKATVSKSSDENHDDMRKDHHM